MQEGVLTLFAFYHSYRNLATEAN